MGMAHCPWSTYWRWQDERVRRAEYEPGIWEALKEFGGEASRGRAKPSNGSAEQGPPQPTARKGVRASRAVDVRWCSQGFALWGWACGRGGRAPRCGQEGTPTALPAHPRS